MSDHVDQQPEPAETKTVLHMSLSVRGALNWPKRKLRIFTDKATGRQANPDQVRSWLMDELAQGHEVIPLTGSEPCEGFDFKTGCPGHREARRG